MSIANLQIEKTQAAGERSAAKKTLVPKLRFEEFDGDWDEKKLGDIVQISSSARVHKEEWTEEGVPFFRSSDVVAAFNGKQNIKAYISFELYNSLSKKIGKVKIDDLLITGGGSIGIPFLIKKNDPLYFKDADLLWIKNNENISGYFLYSFFLTPLFKNHLKSVSHIGTIAHYTVIQAKNTPFNTPSLPEQQKIASFLSSVDEKIQQLTRKAALLQQYKKGVMQQLFSGTLRFKDENGEEYADWEEKKLGEVAKFRRGSFPQPYGLPKWYDDENGMPFIQVYDVDNNMLLKKTTKNKISKLGAEHSVFVKEGTLVITIQGSIGRIAKTQYDAYVDRTLLIFQSYKFPTDVDYFKYVVFLLFEIEKTKAPGGTIKTITKEVLTDFIVPIPCLKEQQKIANFLSSIDSKIHSVNQQLVQTKKFKKGLLQKIFI
ncbi:restriction endonuclease subunit S [Flavobacterium sp. GT3R68]|uniref:restriction endonuclease subunit S n=1 Tax=Flavobacterium sp. GT3R68 TaxID=2594437 RepID=UPI000F89C933|nr:restriction endonuclease subunit S [Flavobacterium sp. GT3R68]RTY90614.1 restriction endonuclease subunit S [Flavobacterium sp. GSN2]TRW89860.1 restriction endonuclease subunit S [Flavobacterium sp. GT3R68]